MRSDEGRSPKRLDGLTQQRQWWRHWASEEPQTLPQALADVCYRFCGHNPDQHDPTCRLIRAAIFAAAVGKPDDQPDGAA